MIFIRFIYWIFERQILKIYFNKQSHKKGLKNLIKVFVDSNGIKYYTWENENDIPIQRTKEIEKRLIRLKSGLSDENMNMMLDAMEKALNKGVKPDLATIGYIIKEMRNRQDLLLHPDLMFDLVALRYVREDETPTEVNESIHKDKIEQFKKDSKDGLYDFFYEMGMSGYMPYITKLESDWNMLWAESKIKIQAMNNLLQNYITKQN